jgi:hypothetical protein
MKLRLVFAGILLGMLFIASCKKEEEPQKNENYLIFGHFYGECIGETCIEIYCLEDSRLLEDQNDNYPSSQNFYVADFTALPNNDFLEVNDLMTFFPDTLLLIDDTVIGMPDAGDWGGFYVEYNFNGIRKFWLIDRVGSSIPASLHPFITEVENKIALINN